MQEYPQHVNEPHDTTSYFEFAFYLCFYFMHVFEYLQGFDVFSKSLIIRLLKRNCE